MNELDTLNTEYGLCLDLERLHGERKHLRTKKNMLQPGPGTECTAAQNVCSAKMNLTLFIVNKFTLTHRAQLSCTQTPNLAL